MNSPAPWHFFSLIHMEADYSLYNLLAIYGWCDLSDDA